MTGYEADPESLFITPGTGSGIKNMSGDHINIGLGESFLVDYTFNPTGVTLGYETLSYSGDFGAGTLDNVVTTIAAPTVPVPSALLLGAIGLGAVTRKKRTRKKITS